MNKKKDTVNGKFQKAFKNTFGTQKKKNDEKSEGAGPKPDSDGAKPNKLTKEPGAGPKPDGDEAKPEKQSNAKSKDVPDCEAQPGQNIELAGGAGSNPDGDGAKPEKQSNELTKKPGAGPKPDGDGAKSKEQSNAKPKEDTTDRGAQSRQNTGLAGGAGQKPDGDGAKSKKQSNAKPKEDATDHGAQPRQNTELARGREEEAEENSDESDQEKIGHGVEETDKEEKSEGVLRPGVVQSRLQTNVLDIPNALYRTVCIKLNSKDEISFNDYRMLCEKLGYDQTVARGLEQATTVNPTDELLWTWRTTRAHEATVDKLINLLKEEDFCRMDVVKILEDWVQNGPSSRLSTQPIDIPHDIRSKICLSLNIEDTSYRDYRMLGEKLGYNRDKIEGLKQGKANPTDTLIQKWCKENGLLTVSKLIELLKKERMDVVGVLENWVYGKRGL